MTETSTPYRTFGMNRKPCVLNDPYFKQLATFAEALAVGGLLDPEEIAKCAIALTNKLIEATEKRK